MNQHSMGFGGSRYHDDNTLRSENSTAQASDKCLHETKHRSIASLPVSPFRDKNLLFCQDSKRRRTTLTLRSEQPNPSQEVTNSGMLPYRNPIEWFVPHHDR